MSGTSLDGVDLTNLTLTFDDKCEFEIHQSITMPYPSYWIQKLRQLTSFSLMEIKLLDTEYTEYLGEIINSFIEDYHISTIDAVCSHGHTALHQPQIGLTYQMGNLPQLASIINQRVVCDFRVEDVALGGQGAPLVPIGDQLLFGEFDFCLNLGGFANISMSSKDGRIAYDICPVNIVLNHYMNQLGMDYDDKGKLASTGKVIQNLLDRLNSLEFYQQAPPKSLGLEWVKTEVLPIIDEYEFAMEDILRTYVEHISMMLANEINKNANASVLVTGGGAYNSFLMERLQFHTNNTIKIPKREIIEYKEALIFGLLGVLRLRGEVNCLSSVTGASINHSSGKIYCP